MPCGSLRRGLLRVGAWVDPSTSFFKGGFFLALALGGRWSLLPPLLMIVVFARAESTARRNLIVGPVFGFLSLAFLFGVMGPFNFDGLEALYRDWQHNPIIWKWFATTPSMIWVLGLGGALLVYRRPWRDDLSSLTLWSECFALWVLASTVINPWYLLWLLPGLVVSARTNVVGNVDCRDSCGLLASTVDWRSRPCRRTPFSSRCSVVDSMRCDDRWRAST